MRKFRLVPLFVFLLVSALLPAQTMIRPHPDNPSYWQYKGDLLLLLGGSVEDNPFQLKDLESHLDTLVAAGGNYLRCTLSSRDEGDVWPFAKDPETGLYDLNKPEGPFWDKFEHFIKLTRERDIIVQIEVFDRFDYSRDPWQLNPFNPRNNINYTIEESGLRTEYALHPGRKEQPFFRSPPALEDNALLRQYQEIFVERLLQVTLGQPHVLYCISNETNESPEWPIFWTDFIKKRAMEAGQQVQITEMWDAWTLTHDEHRNTWEHPERYTFVDVSQVNHQVGLAHWENLIAFRKLIDETGIPRPLNSVKIYGANSGYYGTTRDAQERFWRNILAGLASSRFHRPSAGLGLSAIAQANLTSMRMFTDKLDIFTAQPDNQLLAGNSRHEAFCAAIPGKAYGLYFPDGGNLRLEAGEALAGKSVKVNWLDIRANQWNNPVKSTFNEKGTLGLVSPREEGFWACVVEVLD